MVLAVVGGRPRHRRAGRRQPGADARANDRGALGREAAANRRVEQRYDLAVDAIKTFHTGVSEDFLLKQDQFKDLRDRLLKSAADFYGKLGALLGQETDLASRRALAQSNFELADLTDKVGRKEDALAAHRAVLAAREALAAEPGADAEAKADVGRSLTAVAGLLEATGKTDEALATYRRSEALLAGLAGSDARGAGRAGGLPVAAGFLLSRTGNRRRRWRPTAGAGRPGGAWPPPGPTTSRRRSTWRTALDRIGHLQEETGRTAEALSRVSRGGGRSWSGLADDHPAVAPTSAATWRQPHDSPRRPAVGDG